MNLFFEPNANTKGFYLNQDETRHLIKVLRKNIGDKLLVTDGKGFFYHCEIDDTKGKECLLKVEKIEEVGTKRNYSLHLAFAPTKNMDRNEFLLEKITEIGVDEITLIYTHHSERNKINFERVEKIVLSAVKQSLKANLPKLNNLTTFKKFIEQDHKDYQKLIAHCEVDKDKKLISKNILSNKTLLLIGPEGDFSSDEINLSKSLGFKSISLGEERLRSETAAIVATTAVKLLSE